MARKRKVRPTSAVYVPADPTPDPPDYRRFSDKSLYDLRAEGDAGAEAELVKRHARRAAKAAAKRGIDSTVSVTKLSRKAVREQYGTPAERRKIAKAKQSARLNNFVEGVSVRPAEPCFGSQERIIRIVLKDRDTGLPLIDPDTGKVRVRIKVKPAVCPPDSRTTMRAANGSGTYIAVCPRCLPLHKALIEARDTGDWSLVDALESALAPQEES